jgi:hypothetical protein
MRRKMLSPTPRRMRSSPKVSLVTSIVGSLGHPATVMSSSSETLMKNRRCARKSPPMSKLLHLLL